MTAEQQRPLYAYLVLAIAATLLLANGVRSQSVLDVLTGAHVGRPAVVVASGVLLSAAAPDGTDLHGVASPQVATRVELTPAVAPAPRRTTTVDRPRGQAQATVPSKASKTTTSPVKATGTSDATNAKPGKAHGRTQERSSRTAADGPGKGHGKAKGHSKRHAKH